MSIDEAEEIMNYYGDRDSREERQNFIRRMERKAHRKEQRLNRY